MKGNFGAGVAVGGGVGTGVIGLVGDRTGVDVGAGDGTGVLASISVGTMVAVGTGVGPDGIGEGSGALVGARPGGRKVVGVDRSVAETAVRVGSGAGVSGIVSEVAVGAGAVSTTGVVDDVG